MSIASFSQLLTITILSTILFNFASECNGQLDAVPMTVKEMSLNQSNQAAKSNTKSFSSSIKEPSGKSSKITFAKNDAVAAAKSSSFTSAVSEPVSEIVDKVLDDGASKEPIAHAKPKAEAEEKDEEETTTEAGDAAED